LPALILGSFIATWVLTIPLSLEYAGGNPFRFIFMVYLVPLSEYQYFGYNALNVFNLFLRNDGESGLDSGFAILFSVLFALIITILVLLVYLSRKNRANLVYLGAYVLLTLSVYFMNFTATNLVVVLGLLVLALIFIRDRRMLMLALFIGMLVTLNASFVMVNAGFFNRLPEADFTNTNTLLWDEVGWMVSNIVLSALTIIAHAYATIVLLDIAMSNKRKTFAELDKPTIGKSLLKFIKN
jgi:hypothetical protein